jgi:hypothetical protein
MAILGDKTVVVGCQGYDDGSISVLSIFGSLLTINARLFGPLFSLWGGSLRMPPIVLAISSTQCGCWWILLIENSSPRARRYSSPSPLARITSNQSLTAVFVRRGQSRSLSNADFFVCDNLDSSRYTKTTIRARSMSVWVCRRLLRTSHWLAYALTYNPFSIVNGLWKWRDLGWSHEWLCVTWLVVNKNELLLHSK